MIFPGTWKNKGYSKGRQNQQDTWEVSFHVKVHGNDGDGANLAGSADGARTVGLVQTVRFFE